MRRAHRALMREQHVVWPAAVADMLMDVYDRLEAAAAPRRRAVGGKTEQRQPGGGQEFATRFSHAGILHESGVSPDMRLRRVSAPSAVLVAGRARRSASPRVNAPGRPSVAARRAEGPGPSRRRCRPPKTR